MKSKLLLFALLLKVFYTNAQIVSVSISEDCNQNGKNIAFGHEFVDLGLSIKWASCNIGAASPENYGDYFAWGETNTKSNFSWSTYRWCNGSYTTLTKYCSNSLYGRVDNKSVLDSSDDVARVKWGGSWRMPTKTEQNELINRCNWLWTTLNGVNGYRVIGPNGNSIFLPAAGYRKDATTESVGTYGYYWLSSMGSSYSYEASYIYLKSTDKFGSNGYRSYGRTVRPVCP